ncbi:MAG: DUF4340 domain-containing protein [Clostridiales Family XIII bacterium]|jgi:hypothetical protein|nr:DUF4340 domain-containing protein [Clostridiales Family XIII bacterium]
MGKRMETRKIGCVRIMTMTFALVLLMTSVVGFSGCGKDKLTQDVNIIPPTSKMQEWNKSLAVDEDASIPLSETIRGISIIKDGAEKFGVTYQEDIGYANYDYWRVFTPYKGLSSVNTEALYQYIDSILIYKQVAEGVSKSDAHIDGSSDKIILVYNDAQSTSSKGDAEPTHILTIWIGDAVNDEYYYVSLNSDETVYKVSYDQINHALDVNPYDYILKIPTLLDIETVSHVRIDIDSKSYLMSSKDDVYKFEKKKVDKKEYDELYGALLGVILDSEVSREYLAETDLLTSPVLGVRYFRKEEQLSDVTVEYRDYDKDRYSVAVNGETFFTVKKTDVDDLILKIQDVM